MGRAGRIVAAALLSTALASAADPTPSELFTQGQRAYDQRRYEAAAQLFDQAYAARPSSAAAYNAALAWDAAERRAAAANAFARAIDAGDLSADQLRDASSRLAQLSMVLGKLSLSGPEGAAISAGEARARIPGTLYVQPGSHRVVAELPDGTEISRAVTVRAGQNLPVSFDPPLATPQSVAAEPTPAPSPPPERDTSGSNQAVFGWGLVGLGAVALGGGVWFNVKGLSDNADFEDGGRVDSAAHDRAVERRTAAFIAYGAAAVLGTVGVVLILSDDDKTRAQLGPGQLSLQRSF